jgi:YidC/Oxa1 family membrane protein insertase
MLNVIYYPVSFILWCWHRLFGLVLGDSSAAGWALAIVFLVFTLRAVLLKPAIDQVRSMRAMQQIAPQLAAIRTRFARDRERQLAEIGKLQREHGISPLRGCLPIALQVPVFIGLNHVLRAFTLYPGQPNYFFPLSDVHSYLAADLFGAHLGDAIVNLGLVGGATAGHATWAWAIAPVAIPLMIVAAVATHLTARSSARSLRSVNTAGTARPQLANRLAMWVFPLGVLIFGGALPVGLLVYWVSNNVWTLGQQHLVVKRIVGAQERGVTVDQRRRRRSP